MENRPASKSLSAAGILFMANALFAQSSPMMQGAIREAPVASLPVPFTPSGPGGSYHGPSDFVPPWLFMSPWGSAWGLLFGAWAGAQPPWSVGCFPSSTCQGIPIQPFFFGPIAWPAAGSCFQTGQSLVFHITLGQIRAACAPGGTGTVTFCTSFMCQGTGIQCIFAYNNVALPGLALVGQGTQGQFPCPSVCKWLRIDVNCSAFAPVLQPANDQIVAIAIVVKCCSPTPVIPGGGDDWSSEEQESAIPMLNRADLNGDGAVGSHDLVAMLAAWGSCPDCAADLDGDGNVDGRDLAVLLNNWAPAPVLDASEAKVGAPPIGAGNGSERIEAVASASTHVVVHVLSTGSTAAFLVICPDGSQSVVHSPPGGWHDWHTATFVACGSISIPLPVVGRRSKTGWRGRTTQETPVVLWAATASRARASLGKVARHSGDSQ